MKILQLCTKVPFPPRDGGASAVFAISKGLAELGHDVTIIAVNPKKHFIPSDVNSKLPINIRIVPVAINTEVYYFRAFINLFFFSVPYHASRFYSNDFNKKLLDVLSKSDYDVIQFEGVYLGLYFKSIHENSKAKIILRAHNVEYSLWNEIKMAEKNIFKKLFLSIENNKLKRFELQFIKKVDGILPISELDLNYFKKITNVKSFVLPYGIDDEYAPGNENMVTQMQSDCNLFYIGALDWIPNQKGLTWFINTVWPILNNDLPCIKLHIAGRNAPKSIIKLISSAENVQFYGEIDDAHSFMLRHSAMVVPLFSGSGIRVKIIQALGYGIPVIATAKAIEGIQADHEKHLLIANNQYEFVNSIKKVLSDKQLCIQLTKNGRELIQSKYRTKAYMDGLINFYLN